MKILQYNVLNGCHDPDRFQKLDTWMKRHHYDVVGFNELNGWNAEKLAFHAADWGYRHSYVFETRASRYYVGIISKSPIHIVATVEKPFHHGLLHIVINKVHYLVTHLSPADSTVREMEARYIAEIVSKIDEPLLLMGDLNTLSPLDEEHYAGVGLRHLLSNESALNKKFAKNGELNFTPMQTLLNAGLIDVQERHSFQFSVPTSYNRDKMHATELRLDYILVNKQLHRLHPTSAIIRNEEVEQLSDHYPIECDWEE